VITAACRAAYSAALFIIGATSAEGQSYYREDMVRGVCRKDGCDDFTIEEVKPVSNHGDGSLHSARIGVFHASFRGRVSRGTEEIYVFCSRARPALVQTSFGKYVAYFLAPHGRAREPRETINHYALYFALCHGVEAGKLAAKDKPSIASQFGYRVPLEALRAVNVNAPEEVVRIAPQ
jgi:hypothetical protein